MIVELTQQTQAKLSAWKQHSQTKEVASHVKATQTTLTKLNQQLISFDQNYRRIAERIAPEHVLAAQNTISNILNELQELHREFAKQRHQVTALGKIAESLKWLEKQVQQAWSIYADQQTRPHKELFELVQHLPEIKRQNHTINSHLRQLETHQQTWPSSDSKLADFDDHLDELSNLLANLSGLAPTIRAFLERVRDGKFTVADLDEEILAWCQQDNRGQAFKITF